MFDQHIICDSTFSNVERDGVKVGYSFGARLPYYRGLGLSMVEDVQVVIDGELASRDDIRVTLRDRTWTLAEMETEYEDRWNFGEIATITVFKEGGVGVGEHTLKLAERLRISYLPFVPTTQCTKTVVCN